MEILYKSTRGTGKSMTASQAILQGLSEDGGLFVPDCLPKLSLSLEELSEMTYQETAYEVMKLFLTDFTEEELKYCISHAYDEKFDTEEIDLSGICPGKRDRNRWNQDLLPRRQPVFPL